MKGRDIKTGRFDAKGAVPDDVLREKLERLAIRFCDQMLGEIDRHDPDRRPLDEEDAAFFKTLSTYYAATRRLPVAKVEEDDGDGFGALRDRINGVGNARDNAT